MAQTRAESSRTPSFTWRRPGYINDQKTLDLSPPKENRNVSFFHSYPRFSACIAPVYTLFSSGYALVYASTSKTLKHLHQQSAKFA